MLIDKLELSGRAWNALKRAGINTVEELRKMSDEELIILRGMGKSTLAEIRAKVPREMTIGDTMRNMNDKDLGRFIAAEIIGLKGERLEGAAPAWERWLKEIYGKDDKE